MVLRSGEIARAVLPVVVAWALARVPSAAALVPGLGLASGGLGLILLAAAAAGALVDAMAARPEPGPGPLPAARVPSSRWTLLFAVSAVWFVGLGQWYTSRLRVSGDEPHYLLMAQSLWSEHDLDLADNLAREDWREYTPGPVAPHFGAPRADGRPFPAHGAGLPLLLAPVYALAGRRGCAALIGLMAAALVVEALRLLAAVRAAEQGEGAGGTARGPKGPAFWAAAAMLGPPVVFYSFHVYTEVPAALALATSARLLLTVRSRAGAAAAALAASALPWLHVKMIPAAAALAVLAALRLRGPARLAFASVAGVMAAAYLAYFQAIFGVPSPLALYGGLPAGESGSAARGLVGLLLDRSFGVLWYAPIVLVAIAGLFSRHWRAAVTVLLLGAAVLLPVLPWRMWWGGQCPPGRFLVPAMPVLAVLAAFRLSDRPATGLARWRGALVATSVFIVVATVRDPGQLMLLNRADRPTRLWSALDPSGEGARYLPSLVAARPDDDRVALVWALAIAALVALDIAARARPRVDALFRGTALPVTLWLVVAAAVDLWARRSLT